MKKNQFGFTLVEIVIVIAVIGLLAATTIVMLRPQEIFINSRNSKRLKDVAAINQAIGQWLAREGLQQQDPYNALGLTAAGVLAITPGDGNIAGEGVDGTTVLVLEMPAYLQAIPLDPDNSTEYRVGTDDIANPQHILVCTDQIEFTDAFTAATYPNGIFCQSN